MPCWSCAGPKEEGLPFLRPLLELDGEPLALADLRWERLEGWLPRFHCQVEGLEISGTIFAPPDEKGFVYLLEVSSAEDCQVRAGCGGLVEKPGPGGLLGPPAGGALAGLAGWLDRQPGGRGRAAGCRCWPGACSPTGRLS